MDTISTSLFVTFKNTLVCKDYFIIIWINKVLTKLFYVFLWSVLREIASIFGFYMHISSFSVLPMILLFILIPWQFFFSALKVSSSFKNCFIFFSKSWSGILFFYLIQTFYQLFNFLEPFKNHTHFLLIIL